MADPARRNRSASSAGASISTQEELAHALGVTFSTINRWENGHAEPSYPHPEGSKDPIGRFAASLAAADISATAQERFYCGNFAQLMAL